ncbi:hypothetical protein Angca_005676 [Angiostrongylus cantonensis]|nr:hypothetical protein Angca_005676 [Angiostrongylus cantonensis]
MDNKFQFIMVALTVRHYIRDLQTRQFLSVGVFLHFCQFDYASERPIPVLNGRILFEKPRSSLRKATKCALMEAIIQGTISALGFLENDVYYQEPDCYETIRDLIRFLRNDNDVMLARRICGERNIIGNDLIPIIKSENVKGKMFDITLRLLVNLTQPAIVSLLGKHPEDRDEWQKYWILEENLRKAKPSFSDTKFFTVLKERLEMYFLETLWEDRLEEDRLVMERIIVLFRYIFAISHTERNERVLVHIASQAKERDFHLSILSIFALIFAEHNPSDIVVAGRQRTTAEKEKAEEELRQVVATEQARSAAQRRRVLSNRHSRFYGSYIVRGFPAVNKKNDLLVNKPIKSLGEVTFLDERKNKKVTAKNRRLQHLIENGSPEEKDLGHRTSYHILIVEEYREMGLAMFKKFSPAFLSKTYLSELILSTHHYLRLLQNAVKSGQLNTVKKRNKIRRRTARSKKENNDQAPLPALVDSLSSEELTNKWSSITNELKDIILGNLECSPDQIPVNSLLDVREEQHQKYAMLKVQRALREGRTKDAMGLYRSSRELWPADGIFGDPDSSVEEQLDEIRAVFFTDLKDVADELLNVETAMQKKFSSDSFLEGEDEEHCSTDEEANEEARFETKEVNFDFPEYVAKHARTDVLRWYVFLLNDFATNSVELNKALVKLLHRIAFDLDMPSRLFQLSLFRIFAQVRTYFEGVPKDDMRRNPLFELFNFGHHLLKKFFSCYGILEDKLAPEILFWKGPKECYEIQNGYGTYEASKNTKEVNAWSWDEELENELRSLYNEYRDMDERPEGMDVLDFIEPNLGRPCTRKQIYKKLKEFALDPLGARANKGSAMDRHFPVKKMKELIEEYNSAQGREEDMVEFLRARLTNNQGEEFSRRRILKQINYQGITYEKKKSALNRLELSEELQAELKLLKQQYDEMDEDDHEIVDLVTYVMQRLSEKKPRRQVERELKALGANITPRNKSKPTKGTQNTRTDDGGGNPSYGCSKAEDYVAGSVNFEPSSVNDQSKDHLIKSPIKLAEKRKRLLSNSDEDDHFELRGTKKRSSPYKSPIPLESTNMVFISTDSLGYDETSSLPTKVAEKHKHLLSVSDEDDDFALGVTKERSSPYKYAIPLEGITAESTSSDALRNDEVSNSPIKPTYHRRRLLPTSDEDDNLEVEDIEEVSPPSGSLVPLKKKSRVIVSDSEED